jgi:hypothetical protein
MKVLISDHDDDSTWAVLRNPASLLLALFLIPVDLFAWTNGELLI